MTPVLVPPLVVLRAEFDTLAPARDRASEGWIGNQQHRQTMSGHNPDESGNAPHRDHDGRDEVRAIDVDDSGPWPRGMSMLAAVELIVARHRAKHDNRLAYVIYERRICSASSGWTWRAYTGSNPHDKHAHFEALPSADASTAGWGVLAHWSPPRKATMVTIEGHLPILHRGDNDPVDASGTYWITRAQRQLGVTADGSYGDRTTAAVVRLMHDDSNRSSANGTTIALPEWRRLFGIWA